MTTIKKDALRIAAVRRFDEINFSHNQELQEIASLAADICGTPVAMVTIVDEEQQLFKVTHGVQMDMIPREISFCTHTLMEEEIMVVPDTLQDVRFANNPLVQSPGVRFYAGANLFTHDGQKIGTLCVLGDKPKKISASKQRILKILAKHVIHLMELNLTMKKLKDHLKIEKKQTKMLEESSAQLNLQNQSLRNIAHIQSHEYRGPVASILGLMNIIREEDYVVSKDYLLMMEGAVKNLDEKICKVVRYSELNG